MDKRLTTLQHVELSSRHCLMQMLAWMWSMIFPTSFLSTLRAWVRLVGSYAGDCRYSMTLTIFKRLESRLGGRAPTPYLSRASDCVWHMDKDDRVGELLKRV